MLTFDVAHVQVRGTDLILLLVAAGFEFLPPAEQLTFVAKFQHYATRAGLAGTVVPVWENAEGVMTFFAAPTLRPLVEVLNWGVVTRFVNRRIAVPAVSRTRSPRDAADVLEVAAPGGGHEQHSRGEDSVVEAAAAC